MDLINNLVLGFGIALGLKNLALCFLGCMIGTLIGVLPGVGPIATIAMLLPITFGLDPIGALIMLAGIYYGAQYGGSTTAILVNIPGEATCCRHHARRPPDGPAGPRGRGAGHCRHRLLHCRHLSRHCSSPPLASR